MRSVIKQPDDGHVQFLCPGCGNHHTLPIVPGNHASWQWNGSLDKPTLTPSILAKSGHYCDHHKPGAGCWCTYYAEFPDDARDFECGICHSFVTDGQIQFLGDCTHHLAGQTVPIPPQED